MAGFALGSLPLKLPIHLALFTQVQSHPLSPALFKREPRFWGLLCQMKES